MRTCVHAGTQPQGFSNRGRPPVLEDAPSPGTMQPRLSDTTMRQHPGYSL
jgi:hypothetical protein